MDSILGALALGDIGKLFPDNDPNYEGADSMKLMEKVISVMAEKGWKIGNIDSTICAQKPKLAPYIISMRERIAEACGCDISQISVKATTEEKLGFTGEELGISATAVCLLEKFDTNQKDCCLKPQQSFLLLLCLMRNSVIVNVISVNSSVYEHHAVIIEIISLSAYLLPTCHNSAVLVVVELLPTPAYPAGL